MIYRNKKLTVRRVLRGMRYRINKVKIYVDLKQVFRGTPLYRFLMIFLSFPFISTRKYLKPILPEVNNQFAHAIERVLADISIKKVVEIGASTGLGSTKLIIEKLLSRSDGKDLSIHLIEISPIRAKSLENLYGDLPFVAILNKSTVTPREHMKLSELLNFNYEYETKMRNKMIIRPLRWLREDLKYLERNPHLWNPTALEVIFDKMSPKEIDFALVDGGFCGFLDTQKLLGARYIALDDINDAKNYLSFRMLSEHCNYELIEHDLTYRNGYAIFRRVPV